MVDTLSGEERVVEVDLSENNLTGELPETFFDLPYLEVLNFSSNKLSGPLSESIAKFKNIRILSCASNGFTGELPKGLAKLQKIEYINLNVNEFSGAPPAEYSELLDRMKASPIEKTPPLYENALYLRGNLLSGEIPASIANHPRWSEFWANIMTQVYPYLKMPPTLPYNYDKIVLEDVDGNSFSLKERVSKSKYTALCFWSDDPSKAAEIASNTAMMKQLLETYVGQVDVIGITWYWPLAAYDNPATLPKVKELAKAKGMEWTQVAGNRTGNWISYLSYGPGYPQVYILNSKGEIVYADYVINNPGGELSFLSEVLTPSNAYESIDYSQDRTWTKVQSATAGTNRDGVNFIITADGYSDRQMVTGGEFDRIVNETVEAMFSCEPMKSYRDYVNVYALRAVSKHEAIGAAMQTAYSVRNNGDGTFVGDDKKLYEAVNSIRNFNDKFMCLVIPNTAINACNTFMYGQENNKDIGVSFAYSQYVSDPNEYVELLNYAAIGGGFGFLADEYTTVSSTIPQQEIDKLKKHHAMGMHLNVSTDKSNLPWQHFIGHPDYPSVGAYEGAYWYANGAWRSTEISCMLDPFSYKYFNAVGRELIVKRIKRWVGEEYSFSDFVTRDKAARDEATKATSDVITTRGGRVSPPVLRSIIELKKQ